MRISDNDLYGDDVFIAHLTDRIGYDDLRESQECRVSVQYNEIEMGATNYGFNQPFLNDEANLYFERMKTFSEMTINEIIDKGVHSWHFYRTGIVGKIKKVFDMINPDISKAYLMKKIT